MAVFEVDGKEFNLQGIEYDSIVIARPDRTLSQEEFTDFIHRSKHLTGLFARHHCTLIFANFNELTFEVLQAKAVANP